MLPEQEMHLGGCRGVRLQYMQSRNICEVTEFTGIGGRGEGISGIDTVISYRGNQTVRGFSTVFES
jgi:hypothetical protein